MSLVRYHCTHKIVKKLREGEYKIVMLSNNLSNQLWVIPTKMIPET